MRMRTTHIDERGVSLVELLVAVAILAVALTPLLAIFLQSLKMSEKAYKMSIATNLARDLAEEIRSKYFWEPYYSKDAQLREDFFPVDNINNPPQPFGLDVDGTGKKNAAGDVLNDGYAVTKSRSATLDDVDDYHGWCRGKDCEDFCATLPASQTVLCQDNTYLETFDGQKYDGRTYPLYADFTRRVEVFNIYPHKDPIVPEHDIRIDPDPSVDPRPFYFYDLRNAILPNLTSRPDEGSATGRTRLKVVKVTVEYTGPVTPPITVEDLNLVVLPLSE